MKTPVELTDVQGASDHQLHVLLRMWLLLVTQRPSVMSEWCAWDTSVRKWIFKNAGILPSSFAALSTRIPGWNSTNNFQRISTCLFRC